MGIIIKGKDSHFYNNIEGKYPASVDLALLTGL
jgi:hypothetical protein